MITAQVFETPPIERGKLFSYSEAFCEGVQIRERGPNPLADLDPRGSISASGFGPGGPNLGRSKSAGTPAHLDSHVRSLSVAIFGTIVISLTICTNVLPVPFPWAKLFSWPFSTFLLPPFRFHFKSSLCVHDRGMIFPGYLAMWIGSINGRLM